MITRLRTSNDVEEKLAYMQSVLQLPTKAAVIRIAIAMSLQLPGDPRSNDQIVSDNRFSGGGDYLRATLTGDDDIIYRALISHQMGRFVPEDEYFPTLFSAHIERGIKVMKSDYQYLVKKDQFFRKALGISSEDKDDLSR